MSRDDERIRQSVETVWRMEFPALVAMVTRLVGDVGVAEEIVQDVYVVALEQWPRDGVPLNPAPWLRATAKHRAIDVIRRRGRTSAVVERVGREQARAVAADAAQEALMHPVRDDLLQLLFLTCHPALTRESQVALTLRLFGGLASAEIARAFLAGEATVATRISRAKATLRKSSAGLTMPEPAELPARLAAVLEVVYLIFNEGYTATAGADWTRPDLCLEAVRLGRVLAGLLPDEPEVHGLSALMQLQASRLPARRGPGGEAVLLADQDRRRWDRALIRLGLDALDRAVTLGGAFGPYALQAAIAACHARSNSEDDTDWARITALYTVLAHVHPSPVVEVNRAVAVARAYGPEHALRIVEDLRRRGELTDYPELAAVHADLLERLGRSEEAAQAYRRAARLTHNEGQQAIFHRRAETLDSGGARSDGELDI